ncbi:bifunctional demethylmenaquinone methyltransferase/2-methoxy-6-polyprenyl-1,4-benzoquinol methylase UbiE [Candidatus Aminicenantes bacterium AC-335-A11]|jgi:demethylmenaquinone methyltransferase/2-methoxy-6-polyprenyl-1,4-benzoquinol methylase|nr:bifunctional demethylmenaquinone methyltransferase/2-methoxy-6-polyprenyl-1,4-benzoquinol methylase UbiE [SCandidatus Aminicenantes bacterium Aminicenantia_JdfR_composite]MCP2596766.1 bifunctional demethylmenaquinone methyltransferase/2-methoxy-6-polyprenyl-1,4-benzoquinol methylase UbiE [Candidatus Aminicenantes bacterium AC-335-G13]MCP2617910.1 bifunctional demethylmenaquinone methyltransferase/2-methoxy-6-polyprenyl-1,4-benzoquinol methylase UbiE [Candidatus Aminicenantes bacterium AC-335-A
MDNKARKIRILFDSISDKYDFLNHTLSFFQDIYWRKKTARILKRKFLNHKSKIKILDLSTGTGDMMKALKREFSKNAEIYGLDFSESMLEIARKKLNKLFLIQGDANKLPFYSDTFDIVVTAFGIRNFINFEKILEEIIRVTKRRGKIVFLEFSKPTNYFFRKIYYFYLSRIVPQIGRLIAKNYGAYYYLYSSIWNFHSKERVISLLSNAGLKNIEVYSFTQGIVSLYIGEKE